VNDPKDMAYFTGIPNIEVFNLILELFDNVDLNYYAGWNVQILSWADQLFLTLFKLRRNPSVRDLARRFKVSEGTVKNTFLTWVSALHQMLFVGLMAIVPSRFKMLGQCLKRLKNFLTAGWLWTARKFLLLIRVKLSDQNDRYSNYKHRITF